MITINLNITNIIVVLMDWFRNRGPGSDQDPSAGQAAAPPADPVPEAEQLRAADYHNVNNLSLGEDDFPETVGQAEGAGGLVVDNEIIVEEEEVSDTGTSVTTESSLISFTEAEAVDDTDGGRAVSPPGERPQVAGLGHGQWIRVRQRLRDTPAHWMCDPNNCVRCENTQNRRVARVQFHLLN